MTAVGFLELLLWPTKRLAEQGLVSGSMSRLRFEETGPLRALDPSWAPAFGLWGGVATVDDIAERTGKSVESVRRYAKDTGLRYAHKKLQRTHAELAVLLWCDRSRPPRDSCRHFGVWPGERRVLCAAGQLLVDAVGGIECVLKWNPRELEARFTRLDLRMEPPLALMRMATSTAAGPT